MNFNYCKVKGCRFSSFHVTSRHECGTCKNLGHGKVECNNKNLQNILNQYNKDTININDRCKYINCIDPETHKTDGHTCIYCHSANKHLKKCPIINNYIIEDDNKFYDIKFDKLQNGEYTNVYSGMGCTIFIRKNKDKLEYYFMHSDSWGQYGDDSSDVPILNSFIYKYTYVIFEE
jgi:hypothetical protein